MVENTLFFCLHVNWPLLPRFKPIFLCILQMRLTQQGQLAMQLDKRAMYFCHFGIRCIWRKTFAEARLLLLFYLLCTGYSVTQRPVLLVVVLRGICDQ